MTKYYNRTSEKEKRRTLRKKQTPAEKILWQNLRNRQLLGVKFRRQYSVDRFIIDFYAPELKLAIEADGSIHELPDQKKYDKARQEYLETFGITFIRITNNELFENPNKAFGRIEEEIKILKEKKYASFLRKEIMNFRKKMLLIVLTLILSTSLLFPCTTAVVSGKFTADGRPLLFKHRDTSALQNKLMYFSDGKFDYIGVVNSTDKEGKSVWMGLNSAGFAIMNSASYNLNLHDTTSVKDREGRLMKMALQVCATVDDFEAFLDTLPKPLGVEANFGVIDAKGGAAYFETGNYDFRKFDANDPGTAPFGYIIRTNYSFSRDTEQGYGYIRYENADQLFRMAAATKSLSPQFILRKVSRCLKHSLTGIDLTKNLPSEKDSPVMVNFRDFIPRNSSASTFVVYGVKPGESPELATMWTILGFQLCAVATPVWVKGGENLPKILVAVESGNAPLCAWAMELKKQCFPITRGNGKYYLNLAAVMNREGTGILQKITPLEDLIFQQTEIKLKKWRQKGVDKKEIAEFYRWLETRVAQDYQRLFHF